MGNPLLDIMSEIDQALLTKYDVRIYLIPYARSPLSFMTALDHQELQRHCRCYTIANPAQETIMASVRTLQ